MTYEQCGIVGADITHKRDQGWSVDDLWRYVLKTYADNVVVMALELWIGRPSWQR